jgi:hypothetical protein
MKFGELKIGALFTYQGQTYIKSSPMIACSETTGEQKFLRQSAEVQLSQSATNVQPQVKKRALTHADTVNAFEEFYRHCEQCLDTLASQAEKSTARNARERLTQAKQRFLVKIG